jgi:hypothetical protein
MAMPGIIADCRRAVQQTSLTRMAQPQVLTAIPLNLKMRGAGLSPRAENKMKKKLLWVFAAVVPWLMMTVSPAGAQVGLAPLAPEVEEARKPAGIPVRDAVPGSIEDRLHALGEETLLVDLARSSYLRPRAIYEMGTYPFQPRRHFNGIIFMETSERMQPTAWAPCRP